MALLLIRATGVAPEAFEGWLQGLAERLERRHDANQRVIKHRTDRRNGVRCFRLRLDEVGIEHMLAKEGLLPAEPTHADAEEALQRFITLLIAASAEL